MRALMTILIVALTASLMGQTTIGEQEKLGEVGIGKNPGLVEYLTTEEGFYSPGGVFVDQEGWLYFIQNFRDKPILRFVDGKFSERPVPRNLPNTWYGPSSFGVSQDGVSFSGSFFFSLEDGTLYRQTDFYDAKYMEPTIANGYPTPWGAVWESVDHKQLVSAVFKLGEPAHLRSQVETKAWLLSQPGGFTIGDDGLLYRNGMLWSATNAPMLGVEQLTYLGRLASGHIVWKGGPGMVGSETVFKICDPDGREELTVEFPWKSEVEQNHYQFDYGLGPWGEFYCLLPPPFVLIRKQNAMQAELWAPPSTGTAELVVVRNHLKYFGRLNDSNVRLRKEPTTNSDILGTYPAKTGFRIFEKGTKEEAIGGQKNVWYHVRLLDGKEGWFFGSFVQNLYDGPNGKPPPWPNVPDW